MSIVDTVNGIIELSFADTVDLILYETVCDLELLEARTRRRLRDVYWREEWAYERYPWPYSEELRIQYAHDKWLDWISSR